jgi:serine/threonine protein kinase
MFIETSNQVISCLIVHSELRLGDLKYLPFSRLRISTNPNYALSCGINLFFLQISDFGLAKLVAKSNDAEASVTKVVGTFGYLAPE